MDYYWYHELEAAEENGQGMIVVKARRKGYSYKNAFGMVWRYNWFPSSIAILAAFEKTFWANTSAFLRAVFPLHGPLDLFTFFGQWHRGTSILDYTLC